MKNLEFETSTVECNRTECGFIGKPEFYRGYVQCPRCSTTDVTITNQKN